MATLSRLTIGVVLFVLMLATISAQRTLNLDELTIADVNAAFANGTLTSEQLTQIFLARIQTFDRQGPGMVPILVVTRQDILTCLL